MGIMNTYRILVIDDSSAIQEDFRKILVPKRHDDTLATMEAAVFGATADDTLATYEMNCASQGDQGLQRVRHALAERRPYALAFIDVRMPPGWDGLETIEKIWAQDPHIQIVLCTAHSDYSWREMCRKLGHSDRLIILKKPFDTIEVEQLADSLTRKWQHEQEANERLGELDRLQTLVKEYSVKPATARSQSQQLQERKLAAAIDDGALTLHYQPLIDVHQLRIVGLEALLRWNDPELGNISPTEFIPIAEDSGLILPLGEFALRQACEQLASWRSNGIAIVPVAVNVSPLQLRRQPLHALVHSILRETGLPPQLLALEITETALVNELAHASELQRLRESGVRIEIDDFGTGYSCLSQLRQVPADMLKIDRSFVQQLDRHGREETILSSIISMAHNLGFGVIAEGVETGAQLRTLQKHGCDVAQGYLLGGPMPAAACAKLLARAQHPRFVRKLRRLVAGWSYEDFPLCPQGKLAFQG